jgi:hypothetical protein
VERRPKGSLEKAFRRYKLFPIAEGMGNTPDEPERYHIGHNGSSLVKTTPIVYGIWAASCLEQSLWHACAGMEKDHQRDLDAGMDLEPMTAERTAHNVAISIPMMIASGCAFLDPVG